MQIHRVKNNESVYEIAREYGVSPVKLALDNELDMHSSLPIGREVLVLTPSRTYNVKSADTLESIAKRFGCAKEKLMRMNPELCGLEKLYQGQLISIKDSAASLGMICANGYFYSGTPRSRLVAALPHLGYVTVCSSVYKDGRIHSLFDSRDTVELIKSAKKTPILRVYLSRLPEADEEKDLASSIAIFAVSGGFSGVALSSINSISNDKSRLESITFNARRAMMENDLLLFSEGEIDRETSYIEYADAGILTYDKLHLKDPPSFAEGERALYEAFANSGESSRAFIEIPSFAYSGSGYIEKRDAIRVCDRRRADISYDGERMLQNAVHGRRKKRRMIFESLENTKAKLEAISELGFMGISFDIGRICTADLMAAASSFDIVSCPAMMPKREGYEI